MLEVRVVTEPGVPRIRVLGDEDATLVQVRPLVWRDGPFDGSREDLHGPGGNVPGVTTAHPQLGFAGNPAILDATRHRAIDGHSPSRSGSTPRP